LPFVLAASLLSIIPFKAGGQNSISPSDDQATTKKANLAATLTPLPEDKPISGKPPKQPTTLKALVIHKPMPSSTWGKVIQYHREQIFALTDKNREVLHEFLFQDDEGTVRTAVFHENAEGNGYWEVWVWDQQ
jgi:hypothetical protein